MYVHIRAFTRAPKRIKLNQRVRFRVRTCSRGKKRAVNVQLVNARPAIKTWWVLSAAGGACGLVLWLTPLGEKLGQWLGA